MKEKRLFRARQSVGQLPLGVVTKVYIWSLLPDELISIDHIKERGPAIRPEKWEQSIRIAAAGTRLLQQLGGCWTVILDIQGISYSFHICVWSKTVGKVEKSQEGQRCSTWFCCSLLYWLYGFLPLGFIWDSAMVGRNWNSPGDTRQDAAALCCRRNLRYWGREGRILSGWTPKGAPEHEQNPDNDDDDDDDAD